MIVNDILEYVSYTPENTNPAILKEMLSEYGAGSTEIEDVMEYIFGGKTLNPTILKQKIEGNDASGAEEAIVGEAVVGKSVLGGEEEVAIK